MHARTLRTRATGTNTMRTASYRLLGTSALLLSALAFAAPTATADEIEYLDLETAQRKTMRVAEVTSETWAKVSFRRKKKGRGPEDQIDSIQVLRVERDDGGQTAEMLDSVRVEIRRGNFTEAARIAKSISGGGWKTDDDTGERYYVSFRSGDPTGRKARPDWKSEYGHFLFCKATYLDAAARKDKTLMSDALHALDDMEVPGREEQKDGTKKTVKIKTGGFLARFAGGNSRFYAEAMVLKGKCLTALAKYDEATKVFEELSQRAIQVPLHPRYAYEAAIGPGAILEAKGELKAAVDAYNRAAGVIISVLDKERRTALLAELGRAYSRARIMGAAVKIREAEASGNAAAYQTIKAQLKLESPEALMKKFGAKPKPVKDALVRGARDPLVRAVASNGIGLANLKAKKYEEAIVAFKEVTVVHFRIRDEAARAHYYLVTAAREAAKQAKGNKVAKDMYESMAADSKRALESTFADTKWAQK